MGFGIRFSRCKIGCVGMLCSPPYFVGCSLDSLVTFACLGAGFDWQCFALWFSLFHCDEIECVAWENVCCKPTNRAAGDVLIHSMLVCCEVDCLCIGGVTFPFRPFSED